MSVPVSRPTIFLVVEAEHQDRIVEEFGSRYAHDYELVVCGSQAETLERAPPGHAGGDGRRDDDAARQ